MKRIITLAALLMMSVSGFSTVITHGSSGGTFTQCDGACGASVSHFDRAEFFFTAEWVDTITLANFGSGMAHVHSTSSTTAALLDVYDGSNWVNVFSYSPLNTGGVSMSTIFASPITFSAMNISGIRLNASNPVNQMYHYINVGMTYTTSTSVSEPGTLAVLALGLLGFGAYRRRS